MAVKQQAGANFGEQLLNRILQCSTSMLVVISLKRCQLNRRKKRV
jgi:hypothetical protein